VVALSVSLLIVAGCGGGSRSSSDESAAQSVAPVQVYPSIALSAGSRAAFVKPLPPQWAISLDVRFTSPTAALAMGLGSREGLISGGGPGWHHVEATQGVVSVDGRRSSLGGRSASRLSLRAERGGLQLRALVITDAADRGSLLLHRLAELHARLGAAAFPVGADLGDRLHIDSSYWTSGFWPGALWQAAALVPYTGMFGRWALDATLAHLGQERADTHDVGFEYGQSSLAAWEALCSGAAGTTANDGAQGDVLTTKSPKFVCGTLRRSVLAAADELVALRRSNARAGTIPTNSGGRTADTIIDSMMNVAILPWARRLTGNPAYARVAARHAHIVARLLVRPDGSTAQAVNFDRGTGRVLAIGTHQGLSATSTWSRGQAWAVYGFSVIAQELHDRSFLRVALRTAGYVRRHLPAGGIPPWDYDARPGSPIDLSAGVITAAGLFHLVSACASLPGACGPTGRWVALGRTMLAASLARAYARPPLGFLPDQVLNERGRGCWCDGGELMFGVSYALEALRLERAAGAWGGPRSLH
jgi:unsaturated chondroitin disaccharide hydrolase